jgi:hypothetical protein
MIFALHSIKHRPWLAALLARRPIKVAATEPAKIVASPSPRLRTTPPASMITAGIYDRGNGFGVSLCSSNLKLLMSALGQKQTNGEVQKQQGQPYRAPRHFS